MRRPEITIVVPVRNGARHLAETLESVLGQSLADFELIVTDDGSTDDSLAIARDFSDARMQVLEHAPLGMAGNWNHGLERARAPWVKVLPQDDLLDADALARAHDLLHRTREPVLYFGRRRVLCDADDPWSREWLRRHAELDDPLQPLETVNYGPELVRRWARGEFRENAVGEPVATLFPTALARSLGGFPRALRQDLDFALWIRLMARGDVCFEPEVLCSFRLHPDGATRRNQEEAALDREHVRLLAVLAADSAVVRAAPEIRRLVWTERARRIRRYLMAS